MRMSFDFVAATVAVLLMMVPGVALGFALFSGMKFSRLEKIVLGIVIGLMAVPMAMFIEYVAFGLLFSFPLYLANVLLVLFAGLGWHYAQADGFTPNLKMPELKPDWATLKKYGPIALLLVSMALAAYIRFAPGVGSNGNFNTAFYEFDPYYYMKLTERLVQHGQIPLFTDDSYYPVQQFQRWPPLSQYMTGSWLLTYNAITGQSYDQSNLIFISDFYPPLVAALMCFIAFLLIREEYNAYFAAIGAAMFAFTPQLIQKFAYGETLEQPWGVYLALLFFGLLLLSLRRNSFRLTALAGLTAIASVLGSQQYIWPMLMFFAFVALQSVLYFLSGRFESRKWMVLMGCGVAFIVGNTLMAFYSSQNFTSYLTGSVLILLAAMAFSTVLFLISARFSDRVRTSRQRVKAMAALAVLAGLVLVVTPLGGIVLNNIVSQASHAVNTNALSKTIAEEGKPTPDMYPGTFGILDPRILLLLTALLPMVSASIQLYRKNHVRWASALMGSGLVLIVFKNSINAFFSSVLNANQSTLSKIMLLFVTNDTSIYIVIGLVSGALIYLMEEPEKRSEFLMLMMLVIYPVVFIGTNRLKFLLHMSLALALTLPLVLGEAQLLLEQLNAWFKVFTHTGQFRAGLIGTLLLVGLIASASQAQNVQQNMDSLRNTQLPPDWVAAFQWMKSSAPADTRVMSWWDYGHWTTFLGQRKTVLNPSNLRPDYDQAVARALVNGNPSDLYDEMELHNATHVMVDGDLIGKWGALVFLSGTCSSKDASVCPQTAEIPLNSSPGQSQYEIEHYFEYLNVVGNCPASALGVPLPMVQSNLGTRYCLTNDQMIYLNAQGAVSNVSRKYQLAGRDNITSLNSDTSYLFATGQNQFVNINPYFEPFGLHNSVFRSAFTQMFFLSSYPGFKLAYQSPGSYVKVFQYAGRPKSAASPIPLPPASTPAPTQAASGNESKPDNATPSSPNASGK